MHSSTRMADDVDPDLDFITLKEAARICRYKRTDVIRKAIKRREIPVLPMSVRHILVPREAVIKWMLARYRGGRKNGSG
jgi:helix-turn-helix protein